MMTILTLIMMTVNKLVMAAISDSCGSASSCPNLVNSASTEQKEMQDFCFENRHHQLNDEKKAPCKFLVSLVIVKP
jgi:hypothetical protein